jgi:hypothetical protein
MCGKDASKRGKATGNNQPARQKNKRVAKYKHQRNNSNGDNDKGNSFSLAPMMTTTTTTMSAVGASIKG